MPIPVRRLLPLVALLPLAPAAGQYPTGATVQQLPSPGDPSEKLAAALRTLAISPNDKAALIAAGQNALALGDPSAAAGFFGRADTIDPRDGRVKAGLASTLVQLGKPEDALRLFAQASALGVPDADLAEDRGLAYDLTGDTTRAQADYRRVLAQRPGDDDARRRLALSQGIAGDRAGAIATLDPLIRRRDIAGWRAQTFVLAMTGDPAGANAITRIMLPTQQAALQPFLVRLSSLTPAQKARAVHFGEMPADRSYTATQLASTGAAPAYAAPRPAVAPSARRSDLAPAVPGYAPAQVAVAPADAAPRPAATTSARPSDLAPVEPARTAVATTLQTTARTADRPPIAPSAAPGVRVAAVTPAEAPLAQAALATAAPPSGNPAPAVTVPQVAANAVPSVATALPMPMPVGSNAASGHFDVPSAVAVRRPEPRVAAVHASVARPVPAPVAADATVGAAEPAPAAIRLASAEPETAPAAKPARTAASRPAAAKSAEEPAHETPARPTKAKAKTTRDVALDRSEDEPTPSRKGRTTRTAKADADERGAKDETKTSRTKRGEKRTAEADEDQPKRKGRAADKADDKRRTADAEEPARDKGRKGGKAKDEAPESKGTPSRIYVQVAGGANVADMDKAWSSVKKRAPELMKGHKPSTTPLRATNRLLVGPFKDEDEAQAFVNKMAGKGMSGFVFKSAKGQKVGKVDAPQ